MSFFKAYDMRGTFGVDFDLDTVYKAGRALPNVVAGLNAPAHDRAGQKPRWLVGRDCRVSSPGIRDALVRGLLDAGADVDDLGLCTTPMTYFFTGEDGYDGSVMITASHNPPSDNGMKVSRTGALPVSYAAGLCDVEKQVECTEGDFAMAQKSVGASVSAGAAQKDFIDRYVEWHRRHNQSLALVNETLKFAVDCSNGTGAIPAQRLFPNAVILNGKPDGTFPAHSPNPLRRDSREQLAAAVRERGLDCGVMFDGDADRAVFVDEDGNFIQPDYLIPLVAKATIRELGKGNLTSNKVIHDIRTSRGVIETIREMGCEPLMVPVGPALAKPLMRKTGAPVGGELAGHYYFSEFHCCDSGVLAAIRVLSEIALSKEAGGTFSEVMKPIMSRYANSGEVNFRVEDKEAAIGKVLAASKAFGQETGRSDIDGIRLEFGDGWFNIRKSNTEPYLRLVAEHLSKQGLYDWLGALESAVASVGGRRE